MLSLQIFSFEHARDADRPAAHLRRQRIDGMIVPYIALSVPSDDGWMGTGTSGGTGVGKDVQAFPCPFTDTCYDLQHEDGSLVIDVVVYPCTRFVLASTE